MWNVMWQTSNFRILRYSSQGLLVTHYDSYDIQYDIVDFPVINRDRLTTDLIKVFDRRSCNFGFVSYLFSPDLKRIEGGGFIMKNL